MYRRTIEVNPFSSESIDNAIMSLRREKLRQDTFFRLFYTYMTEEIRKRMMERYGADGYRTTRIGKHLSVTWDEGNSRIEIKLAGTKHVFVEFGTGVYAGDGKHNATHVPFFPGSWSINHAQTYQAWVAGGMVGEYKYNRPAAHAFDAVIDSMDEIVKICAEKAYSEVYG